MPRTPTCPLCAAELPSRAKTCPNCGEFLPETEPHLPLPPEAARTSRMRTDAAGDLRPAGHLRRFVAVLIDNLSFFAVFFVIEKLTPLRPFSFKLPFTPDAETLSTGADVLTIALTLVLLICIPLATLTVFESSRWQATLGKHICNLRVVDERGSRLTLPHAAARNVVKALVGIIWILHIVILYTRRRQGIHDLLARTYVVDGAPHDAALATA